MAMEDTDVQGTADAAPVGGDSSPAEPSTPDVFDLTDANRLIKVKGSDKPVKFGDHVRGFQSEFTKASQRAAQAERALQATQSRLQAMEQAQRQAASQQQRGGRADAYEALRSLPYLSGQEAAAVVEQIESVQRERDGILLATLKELQRIKGTVSSLNQTHSSQAFEGKINRFVKDAGLPDAWIEPTKKLYLAYEGDDLDQDFPRILDEYVTEQRALFDGERQAKLDKARRVPFVPGRGGQTSPSKPLELKPNSTPADIIAELWPQFHPEAT
jgi:hypothetical protein